MRRDGAEEKVREQRTRERERGVKRSWDGEKEKKAKVKQRKWGSGVLPASLVNTLQTLFAAEHFLQSTQPSLHDSRVRGMARVYICW